MRRILFALCVGSIMAMPEADLECYMGRNPKGHKPYLFDVCQRYRFVQPPQCLKFTQGEVVTRDCDPSFLCEDLTQANLFGEICCCSSSYCNYAPNRLPVFFLFSLSICFGFVHWIGI